MSSFREIPIWFGRLGLLLGFPITNYTLNNLQKILLVPPNPSKNCFFFEKSQLPLTLLKYLQYYAVFYH